MKKSYIMYCTTYACVLTLEGFSSRWAWGISALLGLLAAEDTVNEGCFAFELLHGNIKSNYHSDENNAKGYISKSLKYYNSVVVQKQNKSTEI